MQGARMPRFRIVNQKREDPAESASTIAALLAAGVELRRDEVYRKTGFTMPLPEDETISAPAEAREELPALGDLFKAGSKFEGLRHVRSG